MMKKWALIITCASSLFAQTFPPIQTADEVKAELAFLTGNTEDVGFSYKGTVGDLNGLTLPLSYWSTADY